ncbi:serine protease SplA [Staphylococcus aureus]|uniref:Serine protease SplA n=1 Tax=Staphylococcus aureus TaxID=1280 RepID=A0A380E371_STAAU|nr:serine protease SplA [Staphylococcus aureus]
MNKNVVIKGLAALTILSSIGIAENFTNQPHSIAKAERMSKKLLMQLRHHTIQW